MRAKKSLGQHFLYNPATVDRIADLAKVTAEDHVLEIGPGPGLMTERLAQRAKQVVAVEKDHRLSQALKEKYAKSPFNVKIIEDDFLKVDLNQALPPLPQDQRWKVVANLPYNVATEILFRLIDARNFFSSFHLMFQREVALRIVAKAGGKDYSPLSIMVQIACVPRVVMTLKPGAFRPPPKVDSAVVGFSGFLPDNGLLYPVQSLKVFQNLVRGVFQQRRKMLRKSLAAIFPQLNAETLEAVFHQTQVAPTARPEELPIEKFADIANAIILWR